MIMPRGQQLLMPVNPVFIGVSLVLAFVLSLFPWSNWVWMPDVLLLVLVFWAVYQPQRMGLGLAFVLGMCMDVQQTALLGQHSLAYVLAIFVARGTSRRLMWFAPMTQALQVLPVFVLAHGVQVLVRLASGGMLPSMWLLLAPALEVLLWPLTAGLLLAPQRRAPDNDSNRPL